MSEPPLIDPTLLAYELFYITAGTVVLLGVATGFAFFEGGMLRHQNMTMASLKCVMGLVVLSLVYYAFGYALAFGSSSNPILGTAGAFFINKTNYAEIFFAFVFPLISVYIVSGAMAERQSLISWIAVVVVHGGFTWPLLAHWTADRSGWLFSSFDFIDVAESGLTHLSGGTAALVFALALGPRIGRFKPKQVLGEGRVPDEESPPAQPTVSEAVSHLSELSSLFKQPVVCLAESDIPKGKVKRFFYGANANPFPGHSNMFVLLGLYLFYATFYIGNSATVPLILSGNPAYSPALIGKASVNVLLCSAAGGLTAFLMELLKLDGGRGKALVTRVFVGTIAGAIASNASCAHSTLWGSLLIGAAAQITTRLLALTLLALRIDDPVEAFPLHFGSGISGVIGVAFTADLGDQQGFLLSGSSNLILKQSLGAVSIIAFTALVSTILALVLKVTKQLRVSSAGELMGLDIFYGLEEPYHGFSLQTNNSRHEFNSSSRNNFSNNNFNRFSQPYPAALQPQQEQLHSNGSNYRSGETMLTNDASTIPKEEGQESGLNLVKTSEP